MSAGLIFRLEQNKEKLMIKLHKMFNIFKPDGEKSAEKILCKIFEWICTVATVNSSNGYCQLSIWKLSQILYNVVLTVICGYYISWFLFSLHMLFNSKTFIFYSLLPSTIFNKSQRKHMRKHFTNLCIRWLRQAKGNKENLYDVSWKLSDFNWLL